ncbi:TonB-dependent receptor plug [Rhodomicrobium vannielii ATCC 17100]|uniref:TonB-dependent receptor plug n=1 Tax=Rhodomicrobium vannielii (strain ATCC 17100 / DSM 162 / LMG 4299 / NCIMB 10020 / ATH 3.1.1) TaxID=648757 RepID=E3I4R7_RHOVT|nr:TonB-dependent receptor [Rhodomicrobium vannielii]ADP72739.1 TonB-dependent receptor plug [Rhodomicrobium vannielii ATCC 17100]
MIVKQSPSADGQGIDARRLRRGLLYGGAAALGLSVSSTAIMAQDQASPAGQSGAASAPKAKKKADQSAAPETAGSATQNAAGAAVPPAAGGQTAAVGATATIQDVIVTTRLRDEELQEVPIPVSAVNGETLEREQQKTVKDFAQKVPSLSVVAPNARNTSIAIRGVGKTWASDALEASVGVIVDGVVATIPGMSWGDYADIQQIEVARGPQGTLLGKNTTLGALNITSKAPSFIPEKEVEVTYGSRDLFVTKATASGPIIDDTLAYRASVYFDGQNGYVENILPGGDTYNGQNRWGGRFQFLYTPNENVTNRTIIDHSEAREDLLVQARLSDPRTYSDTGSTRATSYTSRLSNLGYTPFFDIYNKVDVNQQKPVYSSGNGISTQTDWKIGGGYTVTSITAYRDYHFDALNDSDFSKYSIVQGGYLVDAKQYSQELRLTSPKNVDVLGQKFDYTAGLFALRNETTSTLRTNFGRDAGQFYANSPASTQVIVDSLNGVNLRQLESPETTSLAAYGQTTWHATSAADLTLGIRNTYEEKDNSTRKWYFGGTSTDATGIRNTVLRLFPSTEPIQGKAIYSDSWSWLVNPSYKFTDDILGYISISSGEKSGAVQFDQTTGQPLNVEPEGVTDYEIGLKTTFLDKKLTFNPNLYYTEITNYQSLLGKLSSNGLTAISYLGNIPGVRLRGVELEGSYDTPLEGLRLNFGGAYNDAIYTDFKSAPCASDLSYSTTTTCDFTGNRLAGAPRWSGNVGATYSRSVWDGYTGYFWISEAFRSGAYLDTALSKLAWQEGYGLTNLGIGFHPDNKAWDVSIWGKNVFDKEYLTTVVSFGPTSPVIAATGEPRVIGITFRTKL